MIGNWGLVDLETPQSAYSMPSFYDSSVEMQLVFSDEFNTEGRTFYPGDDPYWEAVDLHYWQVRPSLLVYVKLPQFFPRSDQQLGMV